MRIRLTAVLVICAWLLSIHVGRASQPAVTASGAWIAEPAAGATTALGYLEIHNPTMYDVYVVGVTSDVASVIELRQGGSSGEAKVVKELTVAAFGSLTLEPGGAHMLLKELKRPLEAGDAVELTVKTDGGVSLKVTAGVR
ncbi:MAG: copper chaperone PCu(A)C [Acidobacteria bacterium]|nr:copper chaperone PCu(A)C [Acidobacteriota bacterium]